jgi:hypothetical protein
MAFLGLEDNQRGRLGLAIIHAVQGCEARMCLQVHDGSPVRHSKRGQLGKAQSKIVHGSLREQFPHTTADLSRCSRFACWPQRVMRVTTASSRFCDFFQVCERVVGRHKTLHVLLYHYAAQDFSDGMLVGCSIPLGAELEPRDRTKISRANCMFFPTCSTFPQQRPLFPDNVHYSPTMSTIPRQRPLFPDMLHFFPTKR